MKAINLLLIIFCVQLSLAQKAEQPNNSYDLGATINEMTLTVWEYITVK